MKTYKITWDASFFAVNYTSMRLYTAFLLLTFCLLPSGQAFSKKRVQLWAQNSSFLVQPKQSKKAKPMEKRKARAMEKAAIRNIARALSANYVGKENNKHIFKVKLIKKGRVFFDTVSVN